MNNANIQIKNDIISYFRNSLEGYSELIGWCDTHLEGFVEEVIRFTDNGGVFYPSIGKVLRPFAVARRSELKVVFINSFLYRNVNHNDGLALSKPIGSNGKYPFSKFANSVNKDYYKSNMEISSSDLTKIAEQGVLLWNTSPMKDFKGKYNFDRLWESFNEAVIKELSKTRLLYVFVGQKPFDNYWKKISNSNYKILTTSLIKVEQEWTNGDLFKEINNILHKHLGKKRVVF